MPSTYSNIKIQLMATGENNTTWGNVTNINLGTALEEAIVGSADVTFASGNVTLTLTDTNASQTARHMRLHCVGVTGGATRNLIVPSIEKPYIVQNDCADSIVIKTAAGTGVTVPAGKTLWVYNDGVNVVDVTSHLSSLTLSTALPVASGGTGSNTASGARTNLGLGTMSTQNANSVNITGGSITGITDLAVADGGTGASTFTANGILYGNSASALLVTAAGTTGQVLVGNTGGAPSWATLSGIGVTTFSGGTTGLTPASPTTGAITLAGTLGVANGGTGTATAFTAGSVVFAGASGVYSQDNANLFWDNANDRLGIGTATPATRLSVAGTVTVTDGTIDMSTGYSIRWGGAASGIYAGSGTQDMVFTVGSSERMRVNGASGFVGIATTSPTALLTVNGTAKVGEGVATNTSKFMVNTLSGVAAGIQLIQDANESWIIQNPASTNVLTFSNSGTERMRLNAAGDLGIGTTNPLGKLHIDGNFIRIDQSGANLAFFGNAADLITGAPVGAGIRFDNTALRISASSSEIAQFTIGGSFLVGLTSPVLGERLGVSGSIITQGTGGGEVGLFGTFGGSTQVIGAYSNVPVEFRTNNVERMRITGGGNVGLGTNNPATWRMYMSQTGSDLLTLYNSSATGVQLAMADQGWQGGVNMTNGNLILQAGGITERMRIDGSGNVGIGTSSPGTRLDVSGGDVYRISRVSTATGGIIEMGLLGQSIIGIQSLTNASNFQSLILNPNGGNVGIGTATPSEKVQIQVNTGTSGFESGFTLTNGVDANLFNYVTGTAATDKRAFITAGAANQSLAFGTLYSERMRITSAGDVGIGTIAPGARLNVERPSYGVTALFTTADGTGNPRLAIYGSSSGTTIQNTWSSGASNLIFANGGAVGSGTEAMRIDNAGFVGIGTASPSSKFVVSNSGAAGFEVNPIGSASAPALYSYNRNTNAYDILTTLASEVRWQTGASPSERMRITAAGLVGIGTSDPQNRVSIVATTPYIGITNSTAGTVASPAWSGIKFYGFAENTAGHNASIEGGNSASNDLAGILRFLTAPPAGTPAERMRITSSGDIGIGTQAPTIITGYKTITLDDTTGTFIDFRENAVNRLRIGGDNGSAFINGATGILRLLTSDIERMRIDSSGNVGIGTSSPTYRLHVSNASTNGLGVYRDLDVTAVGAAGQLIEIGARDGATFTPGAAIVGVLNNPPTTGSLSFQTRSAGALATTMTITSAGDVGIGTGSPIGKLHVANPTGSMIIGFGGDNYYDATAHYFRNAGATVTTYLIPSATSTLLSTNAAIPLTFGTDNVERMRITATGNVGIGTSAPTVYTGYTSVEIDGASNGGILGIKKAGSVIGYLNGASGLLLLAQSNDLKLTTTGATSMQFSTNASERMRIDSSGNVGIGTSSPLYVLNTNYNANATFTNAGSDFTQMWQNSGVNALGVALADDLTARFVTNNGYAMAFNSAANEYMRITAAGLVGIGTASPGVALDVAGVIRSNAWMYITPNTGTDNALYRANNTGGTIYMGLDNSVGGLSGAAYALSLYHSGAYPIVFSTNATERMRITSSGSLLVGTTSLISSAKVSIDSGAGPSIGSKVNATTALGHIIFENPNGVVGQIYTNGSATVYDTSSDARLKENITDADDAAALIDAIQVRKFDWKVDGQHQRYGFVAQELLPVAPEAVSVPADPDNMMGVDYSKLVPMLVKEIQSLRARVAQLEGK